VYLLNDSSLPLCSTYHTSTTVDAAKPQRKTAIKELETEI